MCRIPVLRMWPAMHDTDALDPLGGGDPESPARWNGLRSPPPGDALLGTAGAAVGELQVRTSDRCNNRCLFCADGDARSRKPFPPDSSRQIEELLRSHAGTPAVMFTTGEPTLNERLPELIRLARSLGYRRVGITTNGRRLSYLQYARCLLAAGLNRVVLSLHGHDARLHEGLTRAPGSFTQSLAGLRNLAGLRGEFPISVHTSTVVTTRNLATLSALVDLLAPLRPDCIVFNVIHPLGVAAVEGAHLVPRYRDVVAAFQLLLGRPDASRLPLLLVDLPHCVTEGMPLPFRGTYGSTPYGKPTASGVASVEHTSDSKERAHRTKRQACGRCRYADRCLGVWENYVAARGWEGLEPVT
jgi:MoaA/NifB/PqqE/SkfB family radical SAM enzyme